MRLVVLLQLIFIYAVNSQVVLPSFQGFQKAHTSSYGNTVSGFLGLVLGGVRNIELVSRLTTTVLWSVQIVLDKILATMLDISGYMFNRMFFDLCINLKRIKNN